MSDKTRYVLDTNVIISALLFKNSNPAKVVRAVLSWEMFYYLSMNHSKESIGESTLFSEIIDIIELIVTVDLCQ